MSILNFVDQMKKKSALPGAPAADYANGLKTFQAQGMGSNPASPSEPVFKAPEKFSYDANTDPAYQAALRQAQQGVQTATNNAMVSLGSRGIGNSSVAVDRGNQIQQQAIGNVNDTVLPQLMSQAYGRYQDQNNNDYRNALANYNVGQDKKVFDAGRADQADNLAINKGQLTGNYVSPENAGYNAEMLANSAAYGGATPEEQIKLHDRNKVLGQMLGKTYNEKTGTWSEGAGTRTVQGQQLDNQVNEAAYSHARDSLLDKRYEKEFAENVKQKGFENALKIAVQQHQISNDNAQIAISQQNANTSSSNASWARDKNNPDNQYKLAELSKLKNGSSADMSKELDGLYTGLTSGQLSASAAISEIDGRVKAGLTSPEEAAQMKKLISTVSSSQPNIRPSLTQDQVDASGGNNPQDLNSAQLEKLWNSDPSGKAAGRPIIDWGNWYSDPRGRVGGISYEAWKQAYGPQLKAR